MPICSIEPFVGFARLHENGVDRAKLPYQPYYWGAPVQFLQDRSVEMSGVQRVITPSGEVRGLLQEEYLAMDETFDKLGCTVLHHYKLQNGVVVERKPWIIGRSRAK